MSSASSEVTMIVFGSDHGGYILKAQLISYVQSKYKHIIIEDVGTTSEENRVDYPDIAMSVCGRVVKGAASSSSSLGGPIPVRGVLLDGAGVASGMAANKVHGIRAAVAHDHFSMKMGRQHNNCNVVCLGGKTLGIEAAKEILDVFINEKFEGDRHVPRLQKMNFIEQSFNSTLQYKVVGSDGAVNPQAPLATYTSNGSASPYRLPK